MSHEGLMLEKHAHTAIITLNNPPANTWTPESLALLEEIICELNEDLNNHALIITSDSEKFFSAGADLSRFNHSDKDKSRVFATAFGDAFESLTHYRGVSIAAINGYAMGGGLEVALCCDLRVAEEHAQMALPEASVGLLPCGLGTQHLPWIVGEAWAKRMILLGERVDAAKACEIGLVHEVVGKGEALTVAKAMAQKVSGQSPTAILACKKLIMGARSQPLVDMIREEREAFVKLWDGSNQLEGVQAFLEKRKPNWKAS